MLYEIEWESARASVIELHTDACETGAGAVCGTQWWAHPWSADQLSAARDVATTGADLNLTTGVTDPQQATSTRSTNSSGSGTGDSGGEQKQRRSMPYLELLALTMAAATWGHQWKRKRIRFHNDCQPVVQAVTKGSSRSPILMTLIRQLHFIAATHEFEFKVEHIRGVTNDAADALSRGDQVRFRSVHLEADPSPTIPLLPPTLDC